MTTPTGGPAVVTQILKLANEVNGLAVHAGRTDLSAAITAAGARWSDAESVVVLAGMQKRGKSSLLNVLLGAPGLLPVDDDIASDVHVDIRRGPAAAVVHRVDGDGGTSAEPIDPAALGRYASVRGDAVLRRGVVGVDVTVDSPLLDQVCLVDTPGVDSLTLGHRHATMAALARADALLFAVSAQDQPILRHELDFLVDAAARVGTVTFVLTKADDTVSAQAMLDENRDRLASHLAPRPDGSGVPDAVAHRLRAAPWIIVSATLGAAAVRLLAQGRVEDAERRRRRSGLDHLARAIRSVAADRELIRAGRLLGLVSSTLDALESVLRDDQVGSSEDTEALVRRTAELDAEQSALAARESARKQHGVDQQLLTREVGRLARTRLADGRRTYEREVAGLSTASALDAYAAALPESLEQTFVAVWAEVAVDAEDHTRASISRYLEGLGFPAVDLDAAKLETPPMRRRSVRERAAAEGFDLVGEGLPIATTTASLGLMGSHLLPVAVAVTPFVAAPFALGAAVAITIVRHRRKQVAAARSRAALLAEVTEAFAEAATEMGLAIDRAVLAWRTAAEQIITEAFTAQQRDLARRRRSIEALSQRTAAEKVKAAATAADRLRRLEDLRGRAVPLGARLDAALRSARDPVRS